MKTILNAYNASSKVYIASLIQREDKGDKHPHASKLIATIISEH